MNELSRGISIDVLLLGIVAFLLPVVSLMGFIGAVRQRGYGMCITIAMIIGVAVAIVVPLLKGYEVVMNVGLVVACIISFIWVRMGKTRQHDDQCQ